MMTRPDPELPLFAPYVRESETSKEAAKRIEPSSGTERARVLDLVRHVTLSMGRRGLTDEEIQDCLAMNPSTERPRRVELVRLGFIRDSGVREATRSGRKAVVWELAP